MQYKFLLSPLVSQLALTLLVIAFLPGNLLKLAVLLALWLISFRRFSRPEIVLFLVASVFFTVMNTLSLQQGIFYFTHPDVFGMPYYELVMWGFYLLHTRRMVGGRAPEQVTWPVWVLALLYALAFGSIPDQTMLLIITAMLLVVGLILFHERDDLAYTGYMILLGAAIEYTGVSSAQWGYPGDPLGGVPLWFITLWGGVGLLLRRLVLPFVQFYEDSPGRAGSLG